MICPAATPDCRDCPGATEHPYDAPNCKGAYCEVAGKTVECKDPLEEEEP
jgi:hypothetical protein